MVCDIHRRCGQGGGAAAAGIAALGKKTGPGEHRE